MTPDYTKPAPGTPMISVASCIEWLGAEISMLKAKALATENGLQQMVLTGTYLHLEVMQAQLEEYIFLLRSN